MYRGWYDHRWHRRPPWWPRGYEWPPRGGPGAEAWGIVSRRLARYLIAGGVILVGIGILGSALAAAAFGMGAALGATWLILPAGAIAFGVAARRTARPVQELVDAAGRLADGDYRVRVSTDGPPSVRAALRSFNEMAGRLEAADMQRRQLLADVGHELRTPLTVIRGEMEAMVDGVRPIDGATVADLLADIEVMERLLEDLRTLSLAEAGILRLEREDTDLGELVADVVADLQPRADQALVDLRLADAPATLRHVDPVRVREIVLNLATNALRATPPGGSVRIGLHRGAIVVSDTGKGIAADELPLIFQRFHKGDHSVGSGLGLTIAMNHARAHGGDITVESVPGKGSVFRVTLPG